MFEKAVAQDGTPEAVPANGFKLTAPIDQTLRPHVPTGPAKSLDPKAMFVLEGMKAVKAQLRSGVCDIIFWNNFGENDSADSAVASGVRGTISFAEGLGVRKDWVYSEQYAKRVFLGHPDDVHIESSSQERTGYYIRTKDQSIQWFEGRGNIDIQLRDAPAPSWAINFDLKAVGFASWVEFNRCLTWETLINVFLEKPTSDVAQPSDNIYVLTWQLGGENSEWIVTVDEKQGFNPTHATMRQRPTNGDPWRTVQEFSTTWKNINSIWVPVHHKAHITQSQEVAPSKLKIEFSWKSVNEPIAESVFKLSSFGAPETVAVVNSSLGTPVVTKAAKRSFALQEEPKSRFSRRGASLIALNVFVLLGLLIFWFAKGRRANNASSTKQR